MRTFNESKIVYHGERARFHYYQCLQLVLRKQIAALVTLWDLPPEFEVGFLQSFGGHHFIDSDCMQRCMGIAFDSFAETTPCGTLPPHAGAEGY
jgi:hypothetical protein